MKREQFIRLLRREAKERGWDLDVDTRLGKGSHYRLSTMAGAPRSSPATCPNSIWSWSANSWGSSERQKGIAMTYRYLTNSNGAGGWIASFPDVPEALTEGANEDEVRANAADALETALLGYMKDGLDIPLPSPPKAGEPIASLPVQSAAKLAFYEAFRQSGLSKSSLARRLGKDEAEIRRMLDPYHPTKLPTLEEALNALGKRLTLVVEPT